MTMPGSSSLLIGGWPSARIGNTKTEMARAVIKATMIQSTAMFHRGALGDLERTRNSGTASTRKIATMRPTG